MHPGCRATITAVTCVATGTTAFEVIPPCPAQILEQGGADHWLDQDVGETREKGRLVDTHWNATFESGATESMTSSALTRATSNVNSCESDAVAAKGQSARRCAPRLSRLASAPRATSSAVSSTSRPAEPGPNTTRARVRTISVRPS